jgi:hypothetical protein
MVAAFGRPSDLRQAKEAFAIRDARSAISNRLAGALPVFQNSAVVEKYLRLFGNKIEKDFAAALRCILTGSAGCQPAASCAQVERLV